MSVETFYTLDDLIARADRLLDEIDTISIDIFDTLFIRRIYDPDLVKYPVASYMARQAAKQDLRISRRTAWRARWDVERAHRKRHGQSHPDHEACYPQYMGEALERLFRERLPEGMLDQVTDFELRLENAMIVPRAALVEWIERVHTAGKRVLLVSDIYLPATHLRRLVEAKGLDRFVEDVVSSADSFRAKASGAAFPLIEERYGLDKGTWLHVGDNPISDGLRPAEFGIRALVIKDASERHRKGIARAVHLNARRKAFWKGRNVQQLMLPLEGENRPCHPLYADGYSFFGILLANFIHGIAAQCRIQKIRRIYFCSREGWTFKKIWDATLPYFFPDGDAPEASYLYVSRMALAPAACAGEGLAHLDTTVAMLPAGNRDFRDICRVFGLDIDRLRPALDEAGLNDDDPIGSLTPGSTPELRRRFGLLLESQALQTEVKRQAGPAREALERYLESEGFFEQDEVALVDIGWLGTIQHYLIKSIEHRDDAPRMHGFLLGATRHIPYLGNSPNFRQYTTGVLFDNYRFDFARSLITNVKDVFEEACRAPHPTLMAYRRTDDGFDLEFRRRDDAEALAEGEQNRYFEPLRQGILDAAARYAAAVTVLEYGHGELGPWINFLMLNRIAYPRTSEVARIRHRSHQDDFAGKHKVPRKFLRQTRTLWDRSVNVLRFNPFIRTYYYRRNALDVLRGK